MKVLLTGGSGFVATHVLNELLKQDHEVVVTVRSAEKGNFLVDKFKDQGNVSFTIVQDIASESACAEAVQADPPFDAVIHTASPFHFDVQDPQRDMLDPAIQGTTNILKAIKKNVPSVKRVVVTSSTAAMLNMANPPDEYNESSWNPTTLEQAISNPGLTYPASKTFAERAAWDFMEKEKPSFTLATINPPFIFGPVLHNLQSLEKTNTSNKRILGAMDGSYKEKVPPTGSFMWVDVRDVALAHVRAMEQPQAAGHRFLLVSSYWTTKQLVEVVRKHFPDLATNLPDHVEDDTPTKLWGFDNEPSKKILGLNYLNFENSIVDTAKSLLAIDPNLQHKK